MLLYRRTQVDGAGSEDVVDEHKQEDVPMGSRILGSYKPMPRPRSTTEGQLGFDQWEPSSTHQIPPLRSLMLSQAVSFCP